MYRCYYSSVGDLWIFYLFTYSHVGTWYDDQMSSICLGQHFSIWILSLFSAAVVAPRHPFLHPTVNQYPSWSDRVRLPLKDTMVAKRYIAGVYIAGGRGTISVARQHSTFLALNELLQSPKFSGSSTAASLDASDLLVNSMSLLILILNFTGQCILSSSLQNWHRFRLCIE